MMQLARRQQELLGQLSASRTRAEAAQQQVAGIAQQIELQRSAAAAAAATTRSELSQMARSMRPFAAQMQSLEALVAARMPEPVAARFPDEAPPTAP
tara:strand:+ start:1053 stop:1343 length:291 start_codon:yes stop_codon:yes gene_type:complete